MLQDRNCHVSLRQAAAASLAGIQLSSASVSSIFNVNVAAAAKLVQAQPDCGVLHVSCCAVSAAQLVQTCADGME